MLSTAIIVFREVLEAGLVIGIVYAATRGVSGRHRWIAGGVICGLLGAGLVAFFAGEIADFLSGMGQEVFNAIVLLLAVAMLGWHNVWMEKHGRELSVHIKQVGDMVRGGSATLYALATVVAVAILREGSEVVLFMHGLVAGGASGMVAGAAIGIVAGGGVGTALYFGLLRIPGKYLFKVTSALILLLAAGLASQAANYLTQADILPALGGPIWDSSGFLSEHSMLGETLKVLVGYDDRPVGIQMVFYVVTLLVIGGAMYSTHRMRSTTSVAAFVLAFIAAGSMPQPARADHKVYSPIVEGGETEIEFRGHHEFDSDNAIDGGQKWKLTAGRGFTDRWFSEIVFEWEKEPNDSNELAAIEFENVFQLTEQGQYWADWGLLAEYVSERGGPDKVELGALFGKELGTRLVNVNVVLEREIGGGASSDVEVEYAWDLRWHGNPKFEFAIQGYGELGDLDGLALDHEHLLGPGFYGKVQTAGRAAWKYDAAVLFGLNDDSPDTTLRFQVEYEF